MLQTQYRHGPPPCHTHTYAMHIRHICTLSRIHGPQEPIHDSSSEPSVWLSSLPGGASGEEPARAGDIRDAASTPGSGRCPGGGHGNPLQYSCLENPQGQRSLASYRPWGLKELDTTEQLSTAQHTGIYTKKTKTLIQKDACTPMFRAALLIITKIWKQLKCPSRDERLKKILYVYTHKHTHQGNIANIL